MMSLALQVINSMQDCSLVTYARLVASSCIKSNDFGERLSAVLIKFGNFELICSKRQSLHHVAKFIKLYFSVSVLVDLCYKRIKMVVRRVDAQSLADFVW